MAAADITVAGKFATIEMDATKREITITNANGVLVNVGANTGFISMNRNAADLFRDGLQHVGEVQLEPGDSIALPGGTPFIEEQCLAAQTTTLWWIPTIA